MGKLLHHLMLLCKVRCLSLISKGQPFCLRFHERLLEKEVRSFCKYVKHGVGDYSLCIIPETESLQE